MLWDFRDAGVRLLMVVSVGVWTCPFFLCLSIFIGALSDARLGLALLIVSEAALLMMVWLFFSQNDH